MTERQLYLRRNNIRRAQVRGIRYTGGYNIFSEMNWSARQTIETEELNNIRANEWYNLRQRLTKNTAHVNVSTKDSRRLKQLDIKDKLNAYSNKGNT